MGIAMGNSLSPSLANMFMDYVKDDDDVHKNLLSKNVVY